MSTYSGGTPFEGFGLYTITEGAQVGFGILGSQWLTFGYGPVAVGSAIYSGDGESQISLGEAEVVHFPADSKVGVRFGVIGANVGGNFVPFVPQCFAGDTKVLLSDGSLRPVEEVGVGDLVAAYDAGRAGGCGPIESACVSHILAMSISTIFP
jgi:hypothetical protein